MHTARHPRLYVPNERLRNMRIGYARVSKADGSQSLDQQRDVLRAEGIDFAGKHNMRNSGTLAQMRHTVARLVSRTLLCRDLVAENGLSSNALSS